MHATWVSFYKQELSIIALASKLSGYAPVVALFLPAVSLQTGAAMYSTLLNNYVCLC